MENPSVHPWGSTRAAIRAVGLVAGTFFPHTAKQGEMSAAAEMEFSGEEMVWGADQRVSWCERGLPRWGTPVKIIHLPSLSSQTSNNTAPPAEHLPRTITNTCKLPVLSPHRPKHRLAALPFPETFLSSAIPPPKSSLFPQSKERSKTPAPREGGGEAVTLFRLHFYPQHPLPVSWGVPQPPLKASGAAKPSAPISNPCKGHGPQSHPSPILGAPGARGALRGANPLSLPPTHPGSPYLCGTAWTGFRRH